MLYALVTVRNESFHIVKLSSIRLSLPLVWHIENLCIHTCTSSYSAVTEYKLPGNLLTGPMTSSQPIFLVMGATVSSPGTVWSNSCQERIVAGCPGT